MRPGHDDTSRRYPAPRSVERPVAGLRTHSQIPPVGRRQSRRAGDQEIRPAKRATHSDLCRLSRRRRPRQPGGHSEGPNTRSHPELGRENPQRRWYCVSRRGRAGRRQAVAAPDKTRPPGPANRSIHRVGTSPPAPTAAPHRTPVRAGRRPRTRQARTRQARLSRSPAAHHRPTAAARARTNPRPRATTHGTIAKPARQQTHRGVEQPGSSSGS